MQFNKHRAAHINKVAEQLAELLEEQKDTSPLGLAKDGKLPKQINQSLPDSQKPLINLTITGRYKIKQGNRLIDCENGLCLGFNDENQKEFDKCISQIIKDNQIMKLFSKEFIVTKVWDWIINRKRKKRVIKHYLIFF